MFRIVEGIIDRVSEPLLDKGGSQFIKPMMATMMYESFFKNFDDTFEGCGYMPFRTACTQYEMEAIQDYSQEIEIKNGGMEKPGDGDVLGGALDLLESIQDQLPMSNVNKGGGNV